MCGIVGVISDSAGIQSQDKKKFLIQALQVDSLRGEDSTGLFTVNDKGHCDMFKSNMTGWDFVQHAKTQKILSYVYDKRVMIGHNRWATRGAINATNAHPFHHGKIVGVHNGSLNNHRNLLPDGEMFDVDSDAVFHSINEIGVEETVTKMNGAYAIIYFDTEAKTLNLFRNEERPLFTAIVTHANKNDNTMLVASEAGMIEWLAERNGLTIDTPVLLKPHTLLSISTDKLTDFTVSDLGKYEPPKSEKSTVRNFGDYRNTDSHETPSRNKRVSKRSKKILNKVGLKIGDTLELYNTGAATYNHKDSFGYIEGSMTVDPWCDIVVHNVPRSIIETVVREDMPLIFGKIKIAVDRSNYPIIHLDPKTLSYNLDGKNIPLSEPSSKEEVKKETKKVLTTEDVRSAVKDVLRDVNKKKDSTEGTPEKKPILCLPAGKNNSNSCKGPRGFISLYDFQKYVQGGCDNCGANIDHNDHDNIRWTNNGLPLCPSCSEELQDWGCAGC